MCKNKIFRKIGDRFAEMQYPGAYASLVSSNRYIGDYLHSCIDDGIEQLVILGAGYDTRAYRIEELKKRIMVFEVDHPATQKTKKEKLKKRFGLIPKHDVYVPVDFNREKLHNRLFESGYHKGLKTLFIWAGVTMYLTSEAVDETLDFVMRNSGYGSSIIFDYIFKSALDGTSNDADVKKWRESAQKNWEQRDEPFTYGIADGTVEEFLTKRGFSKVQVITKEFYESFYFNRANNNRKAAWWFSLAHGTVNHNK